MSVATLSDTFFRVYRLVGFRVYRLVGFLVYRLVGQRRQVGGVVFFKASTAVELLLKVCDAPRSRVGDNNE